VLQNGASVRTHRLALGAAHFVTNGTENNPLLVVGDTRGDADIHCDTLIFSATADLEAFDISIGPGAGIGGHGTWPQGFDNVSGGEVIATQGPAVQEPLPKEPPTYPRHVCRLTVAGDYSQDSNSTLSVSCGMLVLGDPSYPLNSRLAVQGQATIGGTLRFERWTTPIPGFGYASWAQIETIGTTYAILTATEVVGSFDRLEFAPDFVTNRAILTYEPTRVLVTFLPPVCGTEIAQQPQGGVAAPGSTVTLAIEATTDQWRDLTYEWIARGSFCGKECFVAFEPSGSGSSIYDYSGPVLASTGQGTPELVVTVDPAYLEIPSRARQIGVVCYVRDGCGELLVTSEATLTICPADFNDDGTVNSTDVSDFINAWFEDQAFGTLVTDWDGNGVSNSTDVSGFINSWFEDTAAGCGG